MPTTTADGVIYNTADGNIFSALEPANLLQIKKLQAANAFSGGVPTDANGNPDFAAMAKTLYAKGDFDHANAMMSTALGQQQMGAASKMISGMGTWASPPSDTPSQTASSSAPASPTAGAMPALLNALKSVESSGDYGAHGPVTKSGDRAFGAYQVMGSNIGPWTKEILGAEMTPAQFLSSPEAQDAVAAGKFHQYLKQTGNPQDAASMWFTGKPLAQGANRQDVLGTTGSGYVSKFMAALPRGGQSTPQPAMAYAAPTSSPTLPTSASSSGVPTDETESPPGSTHPYAPPPPATSRLAASGASASPPASAPGPQTGQLAADQSRPAPMPASFASPPAPSPNAGALTDPGDPSYGGQVPKAWLAAGHSAADWVRYMRGMAGIGGMNPYAKTAAEQWAKSADELQTSINKQNELTGEQKNARDPLVQQSQQGLAVTRARARADATADNALVPVAQPDGSMTMMPKREVQARAAAGNPVTTSLPGYVTSGQQNLLTKLNDGSTAYAERQIAGERLDALSGLLSTYQTGANSTAFNDAAAKLRSLGIDIPNSATVNPAAMQQFAKNSYANVLSQMREQGNKQFVSEVQSAINSNPNTDLQPEANAAMIAQMQGIRNYHDANFRDYSKWYDANRGASNDAQFQIGWAKQNPVSDYVGAARKEIAPLGVKLPPKSQLVDGQAYMVQGQKTRWSAAANGFVPIGGR